MTRSRRLSLLVVLAVVAVAPTMAAIAPVSVCGVCGSPLEEAANHHGADITPDSERLVVRLDGDGGSSWHARTAIGGEDAAAFLANDSLRSRVVEEAAGPLGASRTDLDHRVEGDDLVVSYRAPDVADRTAGVLLFDAFASENRDGQGDPRIEVASEQVVVHAPPGYSVAATPMDSGVRANGSAVVIDRGTSLKNRHLAFAPEGTVAAGARGHAAALVRVWPALLNLGLWIAALPALLLGATAATLARGRTGSSGDTRWSGTTVAVAVVATASLLVATMGSFAGALLLLFLVVLPGATVYGATRLLAAPGGRPGWATARRLAAVPVVGVGLLGGSFWALSSLSTTGAALVAVLGVAVALFAVLGGQRRGRRGTWAVVTAIALLPALVAAGTLLAHGLPWASQNGMAITGLFVLFFADAAAVLGVPAYAAAAWSG